MITLMIMRHAQQKAVHPLVAAFVAGEQVTEVSLENPALNYTELVDLIFRSEKVICWW
jgi:hypothetical protein